MEIKKINDYEWEIPQERGMRVPARIFASKLLLDDMKEDKTLEQLKNVAWLPGIHKYSIVLPDGHEGYGFPIGGVAALDYEHGGISPGGIGYDINCSVRLLRTNLTVEQVRPKLKELVDVLFKATPAGVGSESEIKLSKEELDEVLAEGAGWAVKNNYGTKKDLEHTEEYGCIKNNNPEYVSNEAKKRGRPQLGSLGSGNHFLEVEYVERIDNPDVAKTFELEKGQVCIMIHCGSRGLGYQVCSDYLREMEREYKDIVSKLPDRELIYAPSGSELAEKYFKAMNCAANYSWANKQMLTYFARKAINKVFPGTQADTVYDVCHNIAKIEEYKIDGKKTKVYVHRKGATRSFGPGSEDIPEVYQKVGQPVLIPGHMGTGSAVLVGTKEAMEKSFGSAPHGAGRVMSRMQANKQYRAETIQKELFNQGIIVKGYSFSGISEEAPGAYKNLDEVVEVAHNAKLALKVARLKPMGVIKG